MANPTTIPGFSSVFDESDLTISAVEPYLGFEAAWVGRRCALTLKGIGCTLGEYQDDFWNDLSAIPQVRSLAVQR